MLDKFGINEASGTARFSGNKTLYEKFLKKFPADENFKKLEQALDAGDAEAAYNAAHTIKGVAGNLSVDSVYEASLPINEVLKAGDIEKAKQLFVDFKILYETACEGIKLHFGV